MLKLTSIIAIALASVWLAPAPFPIKSSVQPMAAIPALEKADAHRIAFRHGLTRIEEITLVGDRWEVTGRDRDDAEISFEINVYDGSITR